MDKNKSTPQLKFIFYNPNSSVGWFKDSVLCKLKGQHTPNKYEAFFDYAINSNAEIFLTTSLKREKGFKGLLKWLLDPFDLLFWCYLNKIKIGRVHFIWSIKSISGKDAIFLMHYGNFTHESSEIAVRGERLARQLSKIEILKVVHLTHFEYNTEIGEKNLQIVRPDILVAENNLLSNSKFYNKFFSNLTRNFYTLPYTPSPRFVRTVPFKERNNKIVATGSITYPMKDKNFIDFFGGNKLQPLRQDLYRDASKYTLEMDCIISDLSSTRNEEDEQSELKGKNKFIELFFYKHPQLNYYKKDIVSIYNSYKMFAVPEEICDLPAIGFIEGMACGCAYIGIDDPMFRDIGMVPGIHYISHDGTVEDFISKVRLYQHKKVELEIIANNGYAFARNYLNPEKVYRDFFNMINERLTMEKIESRE